MHDIAVAFYSRTGTTREVARMLADRMDCPLIEITDVTSRAGLWGDIRCVWDNLLRRHVPYQVSGPQLADCRNLVVMAPVWVGHLAAPMHAFLKDNRLFRGGISAVAVMAARGGFRAAEEVAMAVGRPPHPVLILLQRDIASGAARDAIDEFADSLPSSTSADTAQAPRPAWLSPNEA